MLDPQNQISQHKNDKVIIIALFIGPNSLDNQYQLEELERLIVLDLFKFSSIIFI